MVTARALSVIIPAYNEAGNLRDAYETILSALKKSGIHEYEIIIVDDASTDGTDALADEIARGDAAVRVVHHAANKNLGYNFREGVELARKSFVSLIAGDNEISEEALVSLFSRVGDRDIVTSYTVNPETRPLSRRILSRTFTFLMNTLFGLRLRYYNGACVERRDVLLKVPMRTNSFAYMAEVLVYLVKSGYSYSEVPIRLKGRSAGGSTALKPKKVLQVFGAVLRLLWYIHVRRERVRV